MKDAKKKEKRDVEKERKKEGKKRQSQKRLNQYMKEEKTEGSSKMKGTKGPEK